MPRPKKVTPEMAEQARVLRREGQSFRRIAAQLRLSPPTIGRLCASVAPPDPRVSESAEPTELARALRALRQAIGADCRVVVSIEVTP